jgi:hypothetical protein
VVTVDAKLIQEMFDYVNIESKTLKHADGAFVFLRADPKIAEKISQLFRDGLIEYALLTGGFGKDSGQLKKLGITEAEFQASLLTVMYNIDTSKLVLEKKALNGAENSKFGIEKILEERLSHNNLIIVSHPTQMRRFYAVHKGIAKLKGFEANYQFASSGYEFNPKNPVDQQEVVLEIIRLADWPNTYSECKRQPDLKEDLVDYARMLMQLHRRYGNVWPKSAP